jgi:(p)ppGpp synthase/HD superfamily hydrolase
MNPTITSTSCGCGQLSARYTEALVWATTLHRGQRRKNTQVPYVAHLIAVSSLVLEDGGSETEAIAGLLHDAVEDCCIEIAPYLQKLFGKEVLGIVMDCSDATPRAGEDKEPWAVRKQKYVEHLERASVSALRVSAADKLHNARTTVGDLRESGTWAEFNACYHQSLWYYDAVSAVVSRRMPCSRTAIALALAVSELYDLTPSAQRAARVEPEVPSCPGTPQCRAAATVATMMAPA